MLTSGLTLIKSLQILKDQISNKALQETIGGCLLDLQEGKTFAESIQNILIYSLNYLCFSWYMPENHPVHWIRCFSDCFESGKTAEA